MNTGENRIKYLLRKIVMGGVRQDHNVDVIRKVKMINVISIVGILNLVPLGYSAFTKGDFWLGFFDLTLAFILFGNQVHLRTTGKYKWSTASGVVCTGALFFFLFYTGGVDHSGHLWFYTFPLFSFFLLGSKKGTVATVMLLGVTMVFLSLDKGSQAEVIYSLRFKIRFVASVLVVLIYAYFFESTRRVAQEELTLKNAELEQKIAEKKRGEKALKEAMENAEAANLAKSEFLANMSHELRTPLNHIMGFTELVMNKNFGDLNEVQTEYLGDVLASSKHLLSLINDILDLSKVEAGKLDLELTAINLGELIDNSLNMVKEKAMKDGLHLSTEINGIPESLMADERKLKQILYNLLSNAVKFTPEGGSISLISEIASDDKLQAMDLKSQGTKKLETGTKNFIEISVIDTGIGIAPEHLERILNPFEQVDNSTSRKYQGTGLGLPLSRRLVELHGGRLWVESDGEGRGSTFRFVIPFENN